MKKTKKFILNFIFFIMLIILTFSIILKDQNVLDIFYLMLDSKKGYIIIAILCMLVYLLLEAVNMQRTLKVTGNKTKFLSAVKYSFIGFFFSAITPAARNANQIEEKLNNELLKYHGSSKYIKEHKKIIFKMLITTFLQIAIYYSIPYWIYRSVGFNEVSIIKIIALQSILYATVSGIPLPGAVGVSESGFLNIFKTIFTPVKVSGAMLLNRGVSFYLFAIISGIVVIINMFKTKKEDKNIVVSKEKIKNT